MHSPWRLFRRGGQGPLLAPSRTDSFLVHCALPERRFSRGICLAGSQSRLTIAFLGCTGNALMVIDSLPQAEYQSANQGFPWNLDLVARARTIAVMLDRLDNGFYFNFCLYFLELPVTWHYYHACWPAICLFSCTPCFCAVVFLYGFL